MPAKKNNLHPFLSPFPAVCAHRGDSAHFPENTLPAFQSAAALGVDCIESDVHLTSDGVCVLWHDETVDRMTDGSGRINEYSLSDLHKLDAGYGFRDEEGNYPFRGAGIVIPTLAETLEAMPTMRLNLDLKGTSLELVERFVDTVYAYRAQERVLGASFHARQLKRLRSLAPDMVTSLAEDEVRLLMYWHYSGLLSFSFPFSGSTVQVPETHGIHRIVTPRFVRRLHARGIFIQVWTVNEKEDMLRLLEMGVDGIISDNPRLLMQVMNRKI